MADGTANATWIKSPKWNEKKSGEFSTELSEQQACTFIGAGSVILRKGRTEPVEIKEYETKNGKSYVVKCTLAMYNKNYANLISFGDNRVSRIMAGLEKDDHVFVVGKEVSRKWKNRFGEEKMITEVYVFFIDSDGHTEATQNMFVNPNLQMLLNGNMPDMSAEDEGQEEEQIQTYNEDEYDKESDYNPESDGIEEFNEVDLNDVPWR